jgi:hypothetical protein
VDIPYVEDHLANHSSEAASTIGFVWAACRLNRRRNRVLMTFVSTWQLVSLLSQLMKFGVKKKHTSGIFTNSDLEPLIGESL